MYATKVKVYTIGANNRIAVGIYVVLAVFSIGSYLGCTFAFAASQSQYNKQSKAKNSKVTIANLELARDAINKEIKNLQSKKSKAKSTVLINITNIDDGTSIQSKQKQEGSINAIPQAKGEETENNTVSITDSKGEQKECITEQTINITTLVARKSNNFYLGLGGIAAGSFIRDNSNIVTNRFTGAGGAIRIGHESFIKNFYGALELSVYAMGSSGNKNANSEGINLLYGGNLRLKLGVTGHKRKTRGYFIVGGRVGHGIGGVSAIDIDTNTINKTIDQIKSGANDLSNSISTGTNLDAATTQQVKSAVDNLAQAAQDIPELSSLVSGIPELMPVQLSLTTGGGIKFAISRNADLFLELVADTLFYDIISGIALAGSLGVDGGGGQTREMVRIEGSFGIDVRF